jgi:hypothetical protein
MMGMFGGNGFTGQFDYNFGFDPAAYQRQLAIDSENRRKQEAAQKIKDAQDKADADAKAMADSIMDKDQPVARRWGWVRERLIRNVMDYKVLRSGMAAYGYIGSSATVVTNINPEHMRGGQQGSNKPYNTSAKDGVFANTPIVAAYQNSQAFKASLKDNRPAKSVFFYQAPVKFKRGEVGTLMVYKTENRYKNDDALVDIVFKMVDETGLRAGPYQNCRDCLSCEALVPVSYCPVVFIFSSADELLAIGTPPCQPPCAPGQQNCPPTLPNRAH